MARELSPSAVRSNADVAAKITGRDFACKAEAQPSVLHRKVGTRDIYIIYGTARNTECTFRAVARSVVGPLVRLDFGAPVAARSNGTTTLRMPLESTEAQLIVFAPGEARTASSQSSAEPVVIPLNGKWRFELKPTLDNRFGDYRLPASNTMLGAEAREFLYREEGGSSEWRRVACTYGPHFWKLGPVQRDRALESAVSIDHPWVPYEYSLRWGIENDPGHQGYHGLKDEVPNDFIGLGKLEIKPTTTEYVEEEKGASYYLRASVVAPRDLRARVLSGGELRPAAVWLNGESFDPGASTAPLKQGSNELLMRYDGPGRGYFVFLAPTSPAGWKQTYPLASEWYQRPGLLPFDTRPQNAQPAGVYRTTSPPGLRGMRIVSRGSVSLRVNGMAVPLGSPGVRTDGAREYRVVLRPGLVAPAEVDIRIEQERGLYGGEALPEPVQFECGPGEIELGDWSSMDGLRDYSGGAWYGREIDLSADQIGGDVQLDLGRVLFQCGGLGQWGKGGRQARTAVSRERREAAEGGVEQDRGAGVQCSRQPLSNDPDEIPAAGSFGLDRAGEVTCFRARTATEERERPRLIRSGLRLS